MKADWDVLMKEANQASTIIAWRRRVVRLHRGAGPRTAVSNGPLERTLSMVNMDAQEV